MTTEHLRYAQEMLAENTRLRQELERLQKKLEERINKVNELLEENARLRRKADALLRGEM
jgi:predicted nuclease with TOPRIM domain